VTTTANQQPPLSGGQRGGRDPRQVAIWTAVSVAGAICWGVIALARDEKISAIWLLGAALGTYAIGYRFYSKFIAKHVLEVDDTRATPAERKNNGVDFEPTDRRVLFGHHFAAIAGAGPLVGPVLAAQMGYLPGTIWIIVGVILAGAVQDMIILFLSMRRDGKSLGQMAREEIGPVGGVAALIGVFAIMIILLAVLAMVVVNAMAVSPWATFSIAIDRRRPAPACADRRRVGRGLGPRRHVHPVEGNPRLLPDHLWLRGLGAARVDAAHPA
jgi:carbon starvation protein